MRNRSERSYRRLHTPAEYAAEKLAVWKRALHEQRDAEAALAKARKKQKHELILELMSQVEFLRTKADLLAFVPSEWLITAPDALPDDSGDGEG